MTLRTAVFASGRGSNFQVLVEHKSPVSLPPSRVSVNTSNRLWEVSILITDRGRIGALDRAAQLGVESAVVRPSNDPEEFGSRLLSVLEAARIDMILNAGYLKLIPRSVVVRYKDRMLYLHPALLPAFGGKGMYGRRVHEAALEAGVRLSGVTVHFVNEEYDRGRILAQWPVPVLPGDTPETLAARINQLEHRLYPMAADRLASAISGGFEVVPIPSRETRFSLAEHLGPPPGIK